jgi:hypothetical protein
MELAEPDMDAIESRRRADAVTALVTSMGVGAEAWWNCARPFELGGLTPSQAWVAGGQHTVESLVVAWAEESEILNRQDRHLRRTGHQLQPVD